MICSCGHGHIAHGNWVRGLPLHEFPFYSDGAMRQQEDRESAAEGRPPGSISSSLLSTPAQN